MVRSYVKKTDRASIDEELMKRAVKEVVNKNMSLRMAAAQFGVKKSTLADRVKVKLRHISADDSGQESSDHETPKRFSKYGSRQVFSMEQENSLADYLKILSIIQYGLTFRACRSLAYQFAAELKLNYPTSWDVNKKSGKDWMRKFMSRHPDLSHRKPENTSLARAIAFNKSNVDQFFQNYVEVQRKYHFTPDRIINTDETGISTVLQAPKVIAPAGKKQVGQIVSQERGTLVTLCATITATGISIPPLFVFPRVRIQDTYLSGSVPGSVAYGSKNGWINSTIFIDLLKHIKKHTGCIKDNPILLILDNHEAHVSLAAINFSRENGIVLLTFPPHCTHRMQPLDLGVFGPFKNRLKTSFNDHMLMNPGVPIKIGDIPRLSTEPYLLSFTPKNIINSFEKSGIWPINRLIYKDEDFAASYVSDRPEPPSLNITQPENEAGPSTLNRSSANNITIPDHDSPTDNNVEIALYSLDIINGSVFQVIESKPEVITPFVIRPLPKAAPRKRTRKNVRSGKSRIFTSTPEKERVQELEAAKSRKRNRNLVKRKVASEFSDKVMSKKNERKKRFKSCNETSSSDSEIELPQKQFGSDSDIDMGSESDNNEAMQELLDDDILKEGDYVLVRFPTKKTVRHYVGQITEAQDQIEYLVKFLRKRGSDAFSFPDTDDLSIVNRQDILVKLPKPLEVRGTSRMKSLIRFSVKFSEPYNIQ